MDIFSYVLSRQYINKIVSESFISNGKSAYEIAVQNGFIGSETEWLESLVGKSPYIGTNGNWYIGDIDTGVLASPDLSGFYSEANLLALTTEEILAICR